MVLLTAQRLRAALLLALALSIAACSTIDTGKPPVLDAGARWGLLPFVNHTETPQAGLRAEAIAESLFRSGSGASLRRYPASLNTETLFEPAERQQAEAALEWARRENLRYVFTGSVDEWRYKVGVDGEPAAGVTLQVIEVASGNVLWSATGGQTGWSREALSAVAQKLIGKLMGPVLSAAR